MKMFSVLMSIYHKEKPEYFERAMKSIWDEQTIKPNEIILVEDGKLTDDLYLVIKKWKNKLGRIFITVPLKANLGLGDALNIGLQYCSFELVARMDTDDVAISNRFEQQLKIFDLLNIDICSGWISEFDIDETIVYAYRKVPEFNMQIVKYARKRCPVNHPAVMYKKNAVGKAGGYKKMISFEDYYLWCRMILVGYKFYNIQAVLVNMRSGDSQLQRRRGMQYAKHEYALQRKLLKLNCINYYEFFRNIIIRFITRNVPENLIKLIYKQLR